MNQLVQRSITGFFVVGTIIGCFLFSQYSFIGITALLTGLCYYEFADLLKAMKVKVHLVLGIVISLALVALVYLNASLGVSLHWAVLLLPLVFVLFFVELFHKHEAAFLNLSFTLMGVLYIAFPFALSAYLVFPAFSAGNYNYHLLLYVFILVWTSDTGAYLVGRSFGKHKLFERISPKKTWEGFFGGVILTIGAALICSLFVTEIPLLHWIFIGIIISVTGTLGDLFESKLKRTVGVKDSGKFLPGHGGFLDRFDAAVFAIPAFFAYLQIANLI